MVSKSANYCCTSRTNNTGLLLLCDVALGNMYEARKAEYIEKLPTGFHSTKGLGKTAPDATNVKDLDGATVEELLIVGFFSKFHCCRFPSAAASRTLSSRLTSSITSSLCTMSGRSTPSISSG